MYQLKNDTLLQGLCENNRPIEVDPDSREVLKMTRLLYAFIEVLGEYDDAGERYEKICEKLAPVFKELDEMLLENIRFLMNGRKKN